MEIDSTPLQRAIKAAGSEAKLGAKTGFTQAAINKAKHRRISAEMALAIDKAGVGVSKEDLRPDLFPVADRAELREQSQKLEA